MDINEKTLEFFRDDVNNFSDLDKLIKETEDKIKPLKDKLKFLKTKKQELEKDICNVLDKNNLDKVEVTEKRVVLEYQVKKAVVPMSQKFIKDKIIKFFEKDGPGADQSFNSKTAIEKAAELFHFLYGKENRDFKTKEQLKIKDMR